MNRSREAGRIRNGQSLVATRLSRPLSRSINMKFNTKEVVSSALLGAILSAIGTLLVQGYLNPAIAPLAKSVGEYKCLYHSTSGSGEIVEGDFVLSRTLFGGIDVRLSFEDISTPKDDAFTFSGDASIRKGFVAIQASGENHDEHLQIVIEKPLTHVFRNEVGIVVGRTLEGSPFAGKIVVYSDETTREEAVKKLQFNQNFVVKPRL